jgi:outer membrane receptor for monomeric catechols
MGLVDSSSVTQNAVAETGGRYKTYAGYIQDDIKVSSRLTINLGLRCNVWGTFKEVYNRMSFFNPDLPNPDW